MGDNMEDMLRSEFASQFLENSPYGFCIVQMELDSSGSPMDFKIIYANNAFAEVENIQKEHILNRNFCEMFPMACETYLQRFYESAYKDKE